MPTPDSIDRAPSPIPTSGSADLLGPAAAPAQWTTPGLTPWEKIFGPPKDPQVVFINPTTRQAVRTSDASQIASLVSAGFERHIVAPQDWPAFEATLGQNLVTLNGGGGGATDIPLPSQAPLSPDQIAALQAGITDTNSQASAAQDNLQKAFNISQPARDRAAVQAKEGYTTTIQPTLSAGAFGGAGYHQPLHDLFLGRVSRDRNLANVADQNTSSAFQFDVSSQNLEQQRQAALQSAYNQALQGSQTSFNNSVDALLGWLKS